MSLSNHSEMKSKDILDILFPESASCKLRSINNNMAFDIYFYEDVYGHLKLTEMECVLGKPKITRESFSNLYHKNTFKILCLLLIQKHTYITIKRTI